MASISKYNGKGYTGLVNLGNTCFLNACIQALSHTYEMSEILESTKIKKHINPKIDSEILQEWIELHNIMWQQNGVISPNKFVHNVHRIAKIKNKDIFTGWSQNDMPEFLLFIIECVHNSLARPVDIKISGKSENKTDELAVKCYKMLSDSYKKEYSEIMDLFYGIYVSRISTIDGKKIYNMKPESYFILDLPINRSTIYDCFDCFIHPEVLTDENAWYNEKTKKRENIKKDIIFWNFPNILIITLKRFSSDGKQKIEDLIDFPLKNLNLTKYVHGYNATEYIYDLYAVCNHIGNIYMGHYTAFVKNSSDEWLHYNDQTVEKIDNPETAIVTPMAYCLFYRKKNKIV